jgi:hypothetical protein
MLISPAHAQTWVRAIFFGTVPPPLHHAPIRLPLQPRAHLGWAIISVLGYLASGFTAGNNSFCLGGEGGILNTYLTRVYAHKITVFLASILVAMIRPKPLCQVFRMRPIIDEFILETGFREDFCCFVLRILPRTSSLASVFARYKR